MPAFGVDSHQDVARQQFAHHFGGVRAFDGNGCRHVQPDPPGCSRASRGPSPPAIKARRLAMDFSRMRATPTSRMMSSPGSQGVERRDLRGAAQKAEGVVAAVHGPLRNQTAACARTSR